MSDWLHPQDAGYPFEEVMSHHRTSRGNAMSSETAILAVLADEDAVIHQIVRWATDGLLNAAVNTPVEQEAMQAIVDGSLRKRLQASKAPDSREGGEARWEVWARHLAPLVHDGLIDAPGERQIIDKAFTLARLLDEHLPADSREGGEA